MGDIVSMWLDHKKHLRVCPFSTYPEIAVRPRYVVHESDIDELVLQITALRAEVERLRAGGCARDQNTTQYCAEASRMTAENERLRTALEWYGEQARLCRLIHGEGDAGRKALDDDGGLRARTALQDKSDESPEGKAAIERAHEASKP